ncbi:hypothetical protein K1719_015009 [Acacia pycnantha]|nr:hypothetical protein K1719_015009 [Acacia pycnantha]
MEVLKETLIRHGFTFESETDTEVIFQNLQKILLGVNKRGVHFFRPVPKECLHSALLEDIELYGSNNTTVVFKIRVARVLHIFEFETKQAEEICAALKTHINDVMLRKLLVNVIGSNQHAMKRIRLFRIVFLNEDLSKNAKP